MQEDPDFQIIKRSHQNSVKYHLAQPFLKDYKGESIICSFADMDFKLSPQIEAATQKLLGEQPNGQKFVNLGYTILGEQAKNCVNNWVEKRYYPKVRELPPFIQWTNMLTYYYAAIQCLTVKGDEILVLTPTYYRFLLVLKGLNRVAKQYQLKTQILPSGLARFKIDFQELEETFKQNKIKMMVIASPHNPTGRIYSKEQLQKLTSLLLKYNVLLFSDQIYSDTLMSTQNFTSMLQFEELHPQLLYGCSFGKAFNCSGISFAYAIIPNKSLHQKLDMFRNLSAAYANPYCIALAVACYQFGSNWKKKCSQYLRKNFQLFLEQIKKKQILKKLIVYDLQCSYLVLVDFRNYNLKGADLRKKFQKNGLIPIFMESTFAEDKEREVVRINIAMNARYIIKLVGKLEGVVME